MRSLAILLAAAFLGLFAHTLSYGAETSATLKTPHDATDEVSASPAPPDNSSFGTKLFSDVQRVYFAGPSFPASSDGTFGGLFAVDAHSTITIYERYIVRDETDPVTRETLRTVYTYDTLGRFEQIMLPLPHSSFGTKLFSNVRRVYFAGPVFPANSGGKFMAACAGHSTITIYERYIVHDMINPVAGKTFRVVYTYETLGKIEQLIKP